MRTSVVISRFIVTAALFAVLTCGGLVADETSSSEFDVTYQQDVQAFLNQHCLRCHNADKQTSGVRVDQLNSALEDRHLKLWDAVRRQVDSKAMPPEDEPQPSADEVSRLVSWVDRGLKVARLRPTPKNGGARRLTVAQYRNTLRDLLQLEDDVTDILPPDAVSKDGFVNNQETLVLSPLLLETYLEIAETALNRSVVDPATPPTIQNFRVDLGASINPTPCPDSLILGADSVLLNNQDFIVHQLTPNKPYPSVPFVMQTKFRFIEGYQGNDTVREWRDFDSIYHAVFACMRGSHGYPKGRAYETVPNGLLLRPAIPSSEVFGDESTYGPRANFKISLRELPETGRFRVTVKAARYNDALLLNPGTPAAAPNDQAINVLPPYLPCQSVKILREGIYQVDLIPVDADAKPVDITLKLGDRQFSGTVSQPAFLALRLPAGELPVEVQTSGDASWSRMTLTPLPDTHEVATAFFAFEQRVPRLGVHLGLRRDCGSTLRPVGRSQPVTSNEPTAYVFEGAIRNFPSPDVEKDNVNYLAGVREIGVRSEYTDGRDMPRLLIHSIEFEGPFYETWPPESHRNIFMESKWPPNSSEYAHDVIRQFAGRAFRRPLTDEEDVALWRVYEDSLANERAPREAIKDTLQVILTSPQFLMLIEKSTTPAPEPIDAYELASKLSYFLWNSPPDARLLELAQRGTLVAELDTEVERMIQDSRFQRFTREFVTQWLALDKFQVLEPDRRRFPKLTRDARNELQREPIEFFNHLVQQNLSAQNLITSDFVVANEVVASYYELEQSPDTGFDFVPIVHHRPELGGLLSQAAILAGLSDGREPNPVKRGAWIARRLVAEPPDDPPPNVPALKEDTTQLTLRERLERHRSQPGCMQCHLKIDPWGVPLEEFDAGGRLRTETVDARSTLPDTHEVGGFADLRQHLATDRIDQIAFSLLKHLSIYASGRQLTYTELESLHQQGLQLKGDGYRLQDMIKFVVKSPIFLEK